MKSRTLTYITAMTVFAAQLTSIGLVAQEQENKRSSIPSKYTVHVLPGLGGLSGAFSINDLSWVAGQSNPPGDALEHALLWRSGEMTDLGTLGGYNSSVASANKNEIGWLAGGSETLDNDPFQENFCQFICSSTNCAPLTQICKGFLWRSKTNDMIALPPLPGGNDSWSVGANNRRQIVGSAENGVTDPNCIPPQVFRFEAVIWTLRSDGTPFVSERLSPMAGDVISAGLGINADGDVVGASGPCGSIGLGTAAHAVLWKRGRTIDLGNLGGVTNNAAVALNNKGQIVGISDLPGDQVTHAFLWTEDDGMTDLGTLRSDDTFSFPNSINDRGEVVGLSCGAIDCHGFIWRQGVMTDLNSFLHPGSSLLITTPGDINSRGEIAVQAFDSTFGDYVAAVMIPARHDDDHALDQSPGDTSALFAVPTEEGSAGPLSESPVCSGVVLPENVRKLVRQRTFLGRLGFEPLGRQ